MSFFEGGASVRIIFGFVPGSIIDVNLLNLEICALRPHLPKCTSDPPCLNLSFRCGASVGLVNFPIWYLSIY